MRERAGGREKVEKQRVKEIEKKYKEIKREGERNTNVTKERVRQREKEGEREREKEREIGRKRERGNREEQIERDKQRETDKRNK